MTTIFIIISFLCWTFAAIIAGWIIGIRSHDLKKDKLIEQLRDTITSQSHTIANLRGIIAQHNKNKGTSK